MTDEDFFRAFVRNYNAGDATFSYPALIRALRAVRDATGDPDIQTLIDKCRLYAPSSALMGPLVLELADALAKLSGADAETVRVPIHPTPEMIEAGRHYANSYGVDIQTYPDVPAQIWRHMIEAASPIQATAAAPPHPITDDQIKHMVNRFLGWRIPDDFHPDAGISFQPEYNVEYTAKQGKPPCRHEPVGTNLLDATQADAMVRYMIEGLGSDG